MNRIAQDFWYGLRLMRTHPGYAVAAILVLALGMGATTGVTGVDPIIALRSE